MRALVDVPQMGSSPTLSRLLSPAERRSFVGPIWSAETPGIS
jgi:hypothetical protein